MYHQIYPELKDVHIEARMDEDGEMRLLGVEAVLGARIILYEEEELRLLEDLYSLRHNCVIRAPEGCGTTASHAEPFQV